MLYMYFRRVQVQRINENGWRYKFVCTIHIGRGTDTDEICIWVVFQVQVQLIYVYEYRGAV